MNVVVLGAGGLGSYLGGVLALAGHQVHLVARGAHQVAVKAAGLLIRDGESETRVRPSCSDTSDVLPDADVALVTVKAFSLDEVASQVARLTAAGTIAIPLCNGVDACERLVALGSRPGRLMAGVAYVTAFRTEPGVVVRQGTHGRIAVGRYRASGAPDARGARDAEEAALPLQELFEHTPIELETVPNIEVELWRKMAVVCSLSVLCGITRASIGPIRATELGRSLQTRAIGEVISVGKAQGVGLESADHESVERTLSAFPPDFYPSVIHDLRQGRPTEMESLGGTISRLGRRLGVETPLHDAANVAIALDAHAG